MSVQPLYKADDWAILNVDGLSTRAVIQESIDLIVQTPPYNMELPTAPMTTASILRAQSGFQPPLARPVPHVAEARRTDVPRHSAGKKRTPELGREPCHDRQEIGFKYHAIIVWTWASRSTKNTAF